MNSNRISWKFTNAAIVDEIISSIKLKKEFKKLVDLSQEGKATLSERGGAGLGLIDITYQSGEVPDFEIVPHEEPTLCNYAIRNKLSFR